MPANNDCQVFTKLLCDLAGISVEDVIFCLVQTAKLSAAQRRGTCKFCSDSTGLPQSYICAQAEEGPHFLSPFVWPLRPAGTPSTSADPLREQQKARGTAPGEPAAKKQPGLAGAGLPPGARPLPLGQFLGAPRGSRGSRDNRDNRDNRDSRGSRGSRGEGRETPQIGAAGSP